MLLEAEKSAIVLARAKPLSQNEHCCVSRYSAWKDGFEALVGKGGNPGILQSPGERPARQVPLVKMLRFYPRILFCELNAKASGTLTLVVSEVR